MDEREELVAAVRAVAARLGASALTLTRFRNETGIAPYRIHSGFGSWVRLCRAAGVAPGARNTRRSETEIFEGMHRAFVKEGGVCTQQRCMREAGFSDAVVRRRYGKWRPMLEAFRRWARRHHADAPYLAALDEKLGPVAAAPPPTAQGEVPAWRKLGGRMAGEPIDFRALAFAPVNEQGVVLLFGMAAEALGYRVETVATAFPDCTARRHVGGGRWEAVRIEFEYKSRFFREHGHDADGCDVVVCWEHDWPACPVEVLALREAIGGLRE